MMEASEPILHKKSFQELTLDELYELLRIRADVFVVEQDCVYQDLDGADRISIEAQEYARGFYEQVGFRQSSEPFILDGIPHIRMTWFSHA